MSGRFYPLNGSRVALEDFYVPGQVLPEQILPITEAPQRKTLCGMEAQKKGFSLLKQSSLSVGRDQYSEMHISIL